MNYKRGGTENGGAKIGMSETPGLDAYSITLGFINRLIIDIENVMFHPEMS